MDESEIIERKKQIEQFHKTLDGWESQLDDLLKSLNWTKDKLPKLNVESVESSKSSAAATESSASEVRENIIQSNETNSIDLNALSDIYSTIKKKKATADTNIDWNKLKRDLKRRRMKYRTTKTAPLTYTEELRELIHMQMDLLQENNQ